MKLSKHSKQRMKERTNLNHDARKNLFQKALQYGKSPTQLKEGPIRKYLESKQWRCKVKLYNGYVFVYSKNTKILYTMYELPEKFREEK